MSLSRRHRRLALLPLALLGLAATSEIPWEEMTEADWVYAIATRFAAVDGHAPLPHATATGAGVEAIASTLRGPSGRGSAGSAIRRGRGRAGKWADGVAGGSPARAWTGAQWAADHAAFAGFRARTRRCPTASDERRRGRSAWPGRRPSPTPPTPSPAPGAGGEFPADPSGLEY